MKRIYAIVAAVLAATALLTLSLCLRGQTLRARKAENLLSATHTAACCELDEQLTQLELTLTKLSVSGSKAGSTLLLADAARMADKAQCTLSRLPVSHVVLADIHTFANQASDYSRSLLDQTAEGTPLSAQALQDALDMAQALEGLRGRLQQLDASALTADALSGEGYFAAPTVTSAESDTADLPTLIYDGPFSDHAGTQKPLGLPEAWSDAAQAESAALAFWGENAPDALFLIGETEGNMPCYVFQPTQTEDSTAIYVSRMGARVVRILSPAAEGTAVYDRDTCLARGKAYLEKRLPNTFTLSGYTLSEGVYTFSFAPLQAGVVLYPDQVKVKVSAVTGDVAGYDASAYYTYHRERSFEKAALTPRDAELSAGTALSVQRVRMALIPTDNRGEQLCYEVAGKLGENTCYLYVNAATGREEDILITLTSDRGLLTL